MVTSDSFDHAGTNGSSLDIGTHPDRWANLHAGPDLDVSILMLPSKEDGDQITPPLPLACGL